MKFKNLAVVAALLLGPSLTHAATIFSDNFDSYAPDQLNWVPPGISGWTITGGTVDLHGAGGGYDVLPGNGSYVDLDGSSFASGLFLNNVNLTGGTTYLLSFDLSGSQRGIHTDTVHVNFGSATASYLLNSTDPFSTFTLNFTPGTDGVYSLSYLNAGGDNRGAFLDNVSVSSVPGAVSNVPEPETYTMILAGLAMMGLVARRRKAGTA
ncbi:putative secreted protein with PEP-CTERM sorting signal [Nitrosospira sp. Nsp2]|uniref:PEP-CTERM sorting domain-containing protein n=1 Tax=Nitrosospira sp. Nsp2 TaxID=136548 RepID=UPI000D323867|nr:PEP-CTERM sorting domain-containing protein [Nitrosospira sp. Nsp2]PTR16131.1 putative secreted protein with PEP-CTERM sorting signal [Nitrosospira sp. Nsp2]